MYLVLFGPDNRGNVDGGLNHLTSHSTMEDCSRLVDKYMVSGDEKSVEQIATGQLTSHEMLSIV